MTPYKERITATLAAWRHRWPAVFTKPVPLAVGIARRIRDELGPQFSHRELGTTLHYWTNSNSYLKAVSRGDMRRNLDGSEAGIPDEAAREHAQKILAEREQRTLARMERKHRRADRGAQLTAMTTADQSAFGATQVQGGLEFRIYRRQDYDTGEDEVFLVFGEADYPVIVARARQRGQTVTAFLVTPSLLDILTANGWNVRSDNVRVAVQSPDGSISDELPKLTYN